MIMKTNVPMGATVRDNIVAAFDELDALHLVEEEEPYYASDVSGTYIHWFNQKTVEELPEDFEGYLEMFEVAVDMITTINGSADAE